MGGFQAGALRLRPPFYDQSAGSSTWLDGCVTMCTLPNGGLVHMCMSKQHAGPEAIGMPDLQCPVEEVWAEFPASDCLCHAGSAAGAIPGEAQGVPRVSAASHQRGALVSTFPKHGQRITHLLLQTPLEKMLAFPVPGHLSHATHQN